MNARLKAAFSGFWGPLVVLFPLVLGIAYERNDFTQLEVVVTSDVSIFTDRSPIPGGFVASFGGAPLVTARVHDVRIRNTGTQPIPASAFEGTIKFQSKSNSRILAVGDRRYPSGARLNFILNDGTLEILPLLLNPQDEIGVTVTSTASIADDLKVSGRIAGVKDLRIISPNSDFSVFGWSPLASRIAVVASLLFLPVLGSFITILIEAILSEDQFATSTATTLLRLLAICISFEVIPLVAYWRSERSFIEVLVMASLIGVGMVFIAALVGFQQVMAGMLRTTRLAQ